MQTSVFFSAVIIGLSIIGAAFILTQPTAQSRFVFTVNNQEYGGQNLTLIYRLDTVSGEADVCFLERIRTFGTSGVAPQPPWCAKDFARGK